jgi:predicted nucleic acid-binding protein
MRSLLLLLVAALSTPALAVEEECIDFAQHILGLKHLEPVAIRGALTPADVTCLETGYANARSQTDKGKISRVLMANAYVTNSTEWARLVRRHLEDVDQSDPDIAYLYANYLFNRDQPDYPGVVRFAQLAYERRADSWEGRVYVVRSHHILRLRAIAELKLWEVAEEAAARSEDDAVRAKAEEQRLRTHTAAREWLDFDRESDLRWFEAAQICVSSGSPQACSLSPGWEQAAAGG